MLLPGICRQGLGSNSHKKFFTGLDVLTSILVFLITPGKSLLYLLFTSHFFFYIGSVIWCGIKCGQKCGAMGGSWWGWEGLQAPISSPDTNSPRETGSTSKLASTHLLQDVWTLSPSVPLNSFPLPRQRAPILSGLSYCQFVFIKFTILARHWEISETQIWFWWKGDIKWGVSITQGTPKLWNSIASQILHPWQREGSNPTVSGL